MDKTQVESLEGKLTCLLRQLQAEHAVFERMVYKNKNQHRRCSYFQYLLKLRRDLNLLRTANMEEILRLCFYINGETKPRQKMHLLESLKWSRCDTGKPNLLERLVGTLRLLSQMAETILKAASELSILLARSFFIGFCVTFLALLARLRLLVQQILLDAVSVFNSVTCISLKKQVVKIPQDGVEVYREFYPKDKDYITLDCIWKTDKFVLLETLQKHEDVVKDTCTRDFSIRYHTFVSFLGEDESSLVEAEDNVVSPSSETNNGRETQDMSNFPLKPEKTEAEGVKRSSSATKVAFLSVKRPSLATCNAMEPPMKKPATSSEDYDLLTPGTQKDSLF